MGTTNGNKTSGGCSAAESSLSLPTTITSRTQRRLRRIVLLGVTVFLVWRTTLMLQLSFSMLDDMTTSIPTTTLDDIASLLALNNVLAVGNKTANNASSSISSLAAQNNLKSALNNASGVRRKPLPLVVPVTEEVIKNATAALQTTATRNNQTNATTTTISIPFVSSSPQNYWPHPLPSPPTNWIDDDLVKLLPDWFVEYTAWHRQTKAQLTPDNWRNHHYLVLHCLNKWPFCSGTADRLRNSPFLVYLASRYNNNNDPSNATDGNDGTNTTRIYPRRILLVYWEQRPFPLEEYLLPVPEPYGLDWRVPSFMRQNLSDELEHLNTWKGIPLCGKRGATPDNCYKESKLLRTIPTKAHATVCEFSFIWRLGAFVDAAYTHNYRAMFHAMFQPAPVIAEATRQAQQRLGLQDGNYTALHLRTKYTSNTLDDKLVTNALQVAHRLGPDRSSPIFVTSDNEDAVRLTEKVARRASSPTGRRRVVGRDDYDTAPALHMDLGTAYYGKSKDNATHTVEEYYSVFVDLLLLAGARCVASRMGTYGNWGRLLSSNYSCHEKY